MHFAHVRGFTRSVLESAFTKHATKARSFHNDFSRSRSRWKINKLMHARQDSIVELLNLPKTLPLLYAVLGRTAYKSFPIPRTVLYREQPLLVMLARVLQS